MTDRQLTETDRADVWKGSWLAGELRRQGEGTQFSYSPRYLADRRRRVAHTLPLTERPFRASAAAVPPFFAGLLPEGERLIALTRRVKTSSDDMLSLLLAVGADTVGDVRVVPHGVEPAAVASLAGGVQAGDSDFGELFATSVGVEPGDGDAVAIAGVQEKVSASVVSFPVRGTATHERPAILKLSPPQYPRLVENESWCLEAARASGLSVTDHEIVHDRNGNSGLLVYRFDRVPQGSETVSLEQEDAAQLAGRYPGQKYRMRSIEVAEVLREVVQAQRLAMRELIALIALSYLIGNGDLHAKNISAVTGLDGETRLAPAYDLVSTIAYLPNDRMALEFEGRDNRLRRADFLAFAERVDVPSRAVHRRLDEVIEGVESSMEQVGAIGLDDRRASRIDRAIRERLTHVKDGA
jgi:serine/threonine-protein kinase HipA